MRIPSKNIIARKQMSRGLQDQTSLTSDRHVDKGSNFRGKKPASLAKRSENEETQPLPVLDHAFLAVRFDEGQFSRADVRLLERSGSFRVPIAADFEIQRKNLNDVLLFRVILIPAKPSP